MSGSFKINTDQVRNQMPAISAQASEIREIAKQIQSCKNQMGVNTGSATMLKWQIDSLYSRAVELATQMDTLKEALESIVQLYIDCEEGLLGHLDGESSVKSIKIEESDETGTDKRGWWRKFIDWVFDRDVDTAYTHTTAEQEAAADARMQQQIQALCETDRFSEETWAAASGEERRKILQEYMRKLTEIMGIKINTKIDFSSRPPSGGYITNGSYTHATKSVYINGYIIDNYSAERSYELMTTMVHELRHAYQHAAVDNPTKYQVSQETIDIWSDSFDNYRGSDRIMREDGVSKEEAYQRYRDQAVEVDARAFAGQD